MNKFTKEEISLCKQMAERYRKDIEYGDWFIMPSDPHLFPTILEASPAHKLWKSEINKKAIPLWTISDCLEFFKERAIYLESLCRTDECEYMCAISETDDLGLVRGTARSFEGETFLISCLKAVLAVLEERK